MIVYDIIFNHMIVDLSCVQVKAATRAVVDASGPSAAAAVQEAFTEYDFGEDEDETPPKGRKKGMTATAEDLPLGEQRIGFGVLWVNNAPPQSRRELAVQADVLLTGSLGAVKSS